MICAHSVTHDATLQKSYTSWQSIGPTYSTKIIGATSEVHLRFPQKMRNMVEKSPYVSKDNIKYPTCKQSHTSA